MQKRRVVNLEVVVLGHIDHGHSVSGLGSSVLLAHFLAHQVPDGVQVHDGAMVFVALEVEVSHTHLTKVPRVVLVEVDSVMVLTTSVTTT